MLLGLTIALIGTPIGFMVGERMDNSEERHSHV